MNRRTYRQAVALIACCCLLLKTTAQTVRLNIATANAKRTEKERLVKMVQENLLQPLTPENELQWESAFWAMELMRYTPADIKKKTTEIFNYFPTAGYPFQRAFLEWLYAQQPASYHKEVNALLGTTTNPRIFGLCSAYLSRNSKNYPPTYLLQQLNRQFNKEQVDNNALLQYLSVLYAPKKEKNPVSLTELLASDFLKGQPVLFSIQRPGRNVPGQLFIRRADGSFVTVSSKGLFTIPQLARSISSLPFYLSMGNTPQGIFLFTGFDVSKNSFIGPTENLQLQMPFETTPAKFLRDSTITDTAWSFHLYNRLLPAGWWQNGYSTHPVYETYIASAAGRDEIIAHGTTVDISYYKNTPYYPFTPTVGCLCTKETWNYQTGERTYSDQQLLVDVLKKEGISSGYLVVLESDKPVLALKPGTNSFFLPVKK
jgi:hypothetical protein